ncbi:MAG: hypothetical protein ACKVI4_14340 [Actinomycetales bacterium]
MRGMHRRLQRRSTTKVVDATAASVANHFAQALELLVSNVRSMKMGERASRKALEALRKVAGEANGRPPVARRVLGNRAVMVAPAEAAAIDMAPAMSAIASSQDADGVRSVTNTLPLLDLSEDVALFGGTSRTVGVRRMEAGDLSAFALVRCSPGYEEAAPVALGLTPNAHRDLQREAAQLLGLRLL